MVDGASPIDLAHFTSFTSGDQQLERELSSLYMATAGTRLDEMGPCVRTERCTDLGEKALLSNELVPALVETRVQRPFSWNTRETPRKKASLPHGCSAKR
jgi:hypothetical protein